MNLQEITAEYSEHNKELQKIKDRIDMREAQIMRLERKKERAQDKAHWSKFANKIMELVSNRTLDIIWNIDKVPFISGMRCQYHVFGKTIEDDVTVGICFTPGSGDTINYDTGETKENVHPNSIASMNGFQNVSKPVESIDELVEMIYRKVAEDRKLRVDQQEEFKSEFIEGDSVVINNRERGILHEFLEPGYCNIFFSGERGLEKVRVYSLRNITKWEKANPDQVENW